MISKENIKIINYIFENIKNKPLFLSELMATLKKIEKAKISNKDFKEWLFSWEATAELDRDPKIAQRVNKAFKEIKTRKNDPHGWEKYKQRLGLI